MTSLFVFADMLEELEGNVTRRAISGAPVLGQADLISVPLKARSKQLTLCDLTETLIAPRQDTDMGDAFAIGALYSGDDILYTPQ